MNDDYSELRAKAERIVAMGTNIQGYGRPMYVDPDVVVALLDEVERLRAALTRPATTK